MTARKLTVKKCPLLVPERFSRILLSIPSREVNEKDKKQASSCRSWTFLLPIGLLLALNWSDSVRHDKRITWQTYGASQLILPSNDTDCRHLHCQARSFLPSYGNVLVESLLFWTSNCWDIRGGWEDGTKQRLEVHSSYSSTQRHEGTCPKLLLKLNCWMFPM